MTVCTPWSFTPAISAEARRDKPAFRAWGAETTTKHLFYSASEGINAELRVNKTTNPLKKLSALIADYDGSITSSVIDEQLKKWTQIKSESVPKVSELVKQANLPALMIWQKKTD